MTLPCKHSGFLSLDREYTICTQSLATVLLTFCVQTKVYVLRDSVQNTKNQIHINSLHKNGPLSGTAFLCVYPLPMLHTILLPSLIPRPFIKEMNALGTRLLTPRPSPSIFRPHFIEYQFVISRPLEFPVMLMMC